MRLIRTISAAAFLLLMMSAIVEGDDGARPEEISLTKLEVPGWQPTKLESYIGKKLYDVIDGYADYHMGFNFEGSERRSFTNGEKRIEVFVHRFDTPENAFGLFSVMRMGAAKLLNIGNEGSLEERLLHMWKGRYYLTISDLGRTECTQEEMLTFAKSVDSQFVMRCAKPSLVEALPDKNMVPLSVAYFHYRNALEKLLYLGEENVLQLGDDFDKPYDVEGAYGKFVVDKVNYELIVLRYDSPKKPEVAYRNFVQTMEDELKSTETNWPWAELVERNGKKTIVFRQGKILMLSFPTAKGDVVKELMQDVLAKLKSTKG
jgi:hypothetical protein